MHVRTLDTPSPYLELSRSALEPKLLRGLDPTVAWNRWDRGVISTVQKVEIEDGLVVECRSFDSRDLHVVVPVAVDLFFSLDGAGINGRIEARDCPLHLDDVLHHSLPGERGFLVVVAQDGSPW